MRGSRSVRRSATGVAWAALLGVLWALLAVTASAAPATAGLTPGATTHGPASGATPRAASTHHGRSGRTPGPTTDAGHGSSARTTSGQASRETATTSGPSAHATHQAPATRAARGAAVGAWQGQGHGVRADWHGAWQWHRSLVPLGGVGLAVGPERVGLPADRLVTVAPLRGPPAPRATAHRGAALGRAPPVSVG